MFDKNIVIDENKALLDSSQVLKQYFIEVNSVSKHSEEIESKINDYHAYLNEIAKLIRKEGNLKITSLKSLSQIELKQANTLEREFGKTKNKKEVNIILNKLDKIRDNLKFHGTEIEIFHDALRDTINILNPIEDNIYKIRKLLLRLQISIIKFYLSKFFINIISIFVVSFFLNYLIDFTENHIEVIFTISHFHVLIFSLTIQTYLFEPYLFNKFMDKVNWNLINKVRISLPVINTDLNNEVDNFNNIVIRYEHLNEFKI